MASEFYKKVFVFDFATMTGGDFFLGSFRDYYNVTISAEMTNLNANTGTIGFLNRVNSSAAWKLIPGMTYTMATIPTDSQELTMGDFGSNDVGVRITANTVTVGRIVFTIEAKQD